MSIHPWPSRCCASPFRGGAAGGGARGRAGRIRLRAAPAHAGRSPAPGRRRQRARADRPRGAHPQPRRAACRPAARACRSSTAPLPTPAPWPRSSRGLSGGAEPDSTAPPPRSNCGRFTPNPALPLEARLDSLEHARGLRRQRQPVRGVRRPAASAARTPGSFGLTFTQPLSQPAAHRAQNRIAEAGGRGRRSSCHASARSWPWTSPRPTTTPRWPTGW